MKVTVVFYDLSRTKVTGQNKLALAEGFISVMMHYSA